MRAVAMLAILAACGRIEFDIVDGAGADAPACPDPHDEDGDGVPDCVDVCPHIAGPQSDRDRDGVGDACDPNPDVARDRIAEFEPLTSQLSAWQHRGTWTYEGDDILADARSGVFALELAFTPTEDTVAIGGHVVAGSTTGTSRQVSVQFNNAVGSYYCELYEAPDDYLQLSTTADGVMYTNLTSDPAPPLDGADVIMTMAQTTSDASCAATITGTPLQGSAPIPAIVPNELRVQAINIIFRLDYLIWIHSS
jgi:hypothetical protein